MMDMKMLLAAMLMSSVSASAQKLKALENTIDLSDVAFRHPATAVFRLRNVSDRSISITDVKTDCGCTTVEYPQTVIARGKTVELKVVYDAKQMGHFEKAIDVYTGRDDKACVLGIKGVVREPSLVKAKKSVIKQKPDGKTRLNLPLMQISPRQVVFRYANKGKQRSALVIKNTGSAPLLIKEVVLVNHDGLKLSVGSKKIKPGKTSRIRIIMIPDAFDYQEKSKILIITNDPDKGEVTIPIIIEKADATDRNR
jgi:hypothetical protein